jgi:hypothetical protein
MRKAPFHKAFEECIKLKTEVDDVQEHEAPAVGSFGDVNIGKKA